MPIHTKALCLLFTILFITAPSTFVSDSIPTFVGSGKGKRQIKNHKALETNLVQPYGIVVDKNDTLYVLNRGHCRRLRIDSKGFGRTFAGTGEAGYNGDEIKAAKA